MIGNIVISAYMLMRRGNWTLNIDAPRWILNELQRQYEIGKTWSQIGTWSQGGSDETDLAVFTLALTDPPAPAKQAENSPMTAPHFIQAGEIVYLGIVDDEERVINQRVPFYEDLPDEAYRVSPPYAPPYEVANWNSDASVKNSGMLYYCPHCCGWIDGSPSFRLLRGGKHGRGRKGKLVYCRRCRLEIAFVNQS